MPLLDSFKVDHTKMPAPAKLGVGVRGWAGERYS